MTLSPISEIIEDAKNGRMFILVDDEDRENEGDLIIPAEMANAEAINFMARHGRGLICLALTQKRVEELRLPLMPRSNAGRFDTAFTVSIEAREGIGTGISAADRARTIQVAIDPEKSGSDIATPGHVFPLIARSGGVLVRAGHTEAAVDIARLAGLKPAGVICEIMKDDGTMARLSDLMEFAKTHSLKIASIADLIAWRLKRDKLVERAHEGDFENDQFGKCRIVIYKSVIDGLEHIALIKGDIKANQPTLVRMHAVNIVTDLLGGKQGRGDLLAKAMQIVNKNGSGVVVILRDLKPTLLTESLKPSAESKPNKPRLRDYGIGAQILLDLGVHEMVLLTNSPKQVIGLDGYDLSIKEFRAIE